MFMLWMYLLHGLGVLWNSVGCCCVILVCFIFELEIKIVSFFFDFNFFFQFGLALLLGLVVGKKGNVLLLIVFVFGLFPVCMCVTFCG